MRRLSIGFAVLLALTAAGAAGCGREEEKTPVACLEGTAPYLEALAAAPGEVRLMGEVPIWDCLTPAQSGGNLADVGAAMIEAATELNAEARAEDGGPAAVQLGYLFGAALRGSEDTSGIHAELLRRLQVAALYTPGEAKLSQEIMGEYRRGLAAAATE